jgi:hypothetical protein
MTVLSMETTRLEALAAEYSAKGYSVFLHPDPSLLPPFLYGFTPDMIAFSDLDNVVIQVKSAREFDGEEVQQLAMFVGSQSLWRYEVALVNLPAAPDVPVAEDLASDADVNRLIENAELLAAQNQTEAAALIAWSAADAILRRLTRVAAPELERQGSARVLKHLYALGQIPPEVYESLSGLLTFRNAVSHGFTPRADVPDLGATITDIRSLQTAA